MEVVALYTTVSSDEDASVLINKLITAKLAACANSYRISSTYNWKDQLVEESEVAILFKTIDEKLPRARLLLEQHHPYEVPLIADYKITVNKSYFNWMIQQLGQSM